MAKLVQFIPIATAAVSEPQLFYGLDEEGQIWNGVWKTPQGHDRKHIEWHRVEHRFPEA
jgi:hypothetical protein